MLDLLKSAKRMGLALVAFFTLQYARLCIFFTFRESSLAPVATFLERHPSLIWLRRSYGNLLLEYGYTAQAARQFMICAAIDPANADYYLLLSEALIDLGSTEEARVVIAGLRARKILSNKNAKTIGRLRTKITGLNQEKHPYIRKSVDGFIEFFTIVRAVILRDLLLTGKTNFFYSMSAPVRALANALGHAYLYILIFRPVPPGMSFLTFCLPVFIIWQAFDHAVYYAEPKLHHWRSQDQISHLKWGHSYAAYVGWDFISTSIVCGAICIIYYLVDDRVIAYPMNFDSLPLFVAMYFIAVLMGLGMGGILNTIKKKVPLVDTIGKLFLFILYLTSGVYETYAKEAAPLREIFKYNPLLPVMEYSRMAFTDHYYIADLDIRYSIVVTWILLMVGLLMLMKAVREEDT